MFRQKVQIVVTLLLWAAVGFVPATARADCTNPASPVGGIAFGSAGDLSTMLACDGTNWVSWAGWSIAGYPAPLFSSSGFAAALNDLTDVNEPSPQDGECLKWVNASGEWQAGTCGGGSGTPDGNDGTIQYNNGGNFGGDDNLFWDDANGRLGINDNTPDVALDVVGDINFTGQLVDVSDIRLKENVRPLQSPLKKLISLNGIAFEMKGDPKHAVEYGVSAQDVPAVFPELVHEVDPNGTLGVAYNGLIAPMIEAMKEQQAQIEALRAELDALKAQRRNEAGEQ